MCQLGCFNVEPKSLLHVSNFSDTAFIWCINGDCKYIVQKTYRGSNNSIFLYLVIGKSSFFGFVCAIWILKIAVQLKSYWYFVGNFHFEKSTFPILCSWHIIHISCRCFWTWNTLTSTFSVTVPVRIVGTVARIITFLIGYFGSSCN